MTEINEVNIARGGAKAEGGGGFMGKIIKIFGGIIVLLIIAGAGYWAVTTFLLTDDSAGTDGGGEKVGSATRGLSDFNPPTSSVEEPHYLELGSFVVNLADGRRYLKINIQLLLNEEKAKAYLELRIKEVQDAVLTELQILNADQLRGGASRTRLRQKLMTKIYSIFPPDKKRWEWDEKFPVQKVLFTEFYLQ